MSWSFSFSLPFVLSHSVVVGVGGGFGVAAREPHGERPARKPCLPSAGPDILSSCEATAPSARKLSQLLFRRCAAAPSWSRRENGRTTRRGTRRGNVVGGGKGFELEVLCTKLNDGQLHTLRMWIVFQAMWFLRQSDLACGCCGRIIWSYRQG